MLPIARPGLVFGRATQQLWKDGGASVLSILIVDDSVVIRRHLRSTIEERNGMSVCGEAENGKIAIEMVRELRPDAVILDLQMPV